MQDAQLDVQDLAAIAAEVDLLTIHLIGENTISVTNSQANIDYAAISNSEQIEITGAEDASLTLIVDQKAQSDATGIFAGSGITNSAVINLELNIEADIDYGDNLYGLKCGIDRNQPGFLENSGSITTTVQNSSLASSSTSTSYGIFIYGGAMDNSGTLDMTVSATNGDVYGLRGNSTTELWNNEGDIFSDVTAYGGNYDGFDTDIYGDANYACAVSVVTGSGDGLEMQNSGTMDLDAVNYAQNANHYEYAFGLELDSDATSFTNSGTIDIEALEAYTWGIYLSNLTDDATLRNSGDITIKATSNGRMIEYPTYFATANGIGINMTNQDGDPDPIKTEMILESGSRLNISVGAAESAKGSYNEDVAGMTYEQWRELMEMMAGIPEDEEITYEEWVEYQCCQGIQLQKLFFADPQYGQVPQDISMADDLIILEGEGEYDGGELIAVFEDFYVPQGMWLYINTIGNYFTDPSDGSIYSVPSKNIVILPKLTGTVTIDGLCKVGETLTAQVSQLPDDVDVSYQWQSCDTPDGNFTDIAGATEQTYKLTGNEVGKYIRILITPVGTEYTGSLTATSTKHVSSRSSGLLSDDRFSADKFSITIEEVANGTVEVSPSTASADTTVTIEVLPNSGYILDELTVVDEDGKEIKITKEDETTYQFTMPEADVTVQAAFLEESHGEQGTCPSQAFTDVNIAAWYHEALDYVIENGLMNGTGNAMFSPYGTVTRAQAVTVLWRLEEEPVTNYLMDFEDVPEEQWYSEAIRWAASEKLVDGYDGRFSPDDVITREQLATILWRYAKYKGYDVSVGENTNILSFSDAAEISEYAYPALQWACGEGLFQGNNDGTLNPLGETERCEFAALTMRFLESSLN